MGLKLYNKKRDFTKTKEPQGKEKSTKNHRFVVQEHHATRLHFDFRLEFGGVMWSWAVPKGPSLNPNDKRLAMKVEDHPIDYMYFQGAIPLGEYGGGEVRTWDIGTYEPVTDIPFDDQLSKGKLTFILHGKKLKGEFHMIHMHGREENAWLLFKHIDKYADENWEIKRILEYGSRVEAPGAKNDPKRKGALAKAVAKKNPVRKTAAASSKIAIAAKAKRTTGVKKAAGARKNAVPGKASATTKGTVAKKTTVAKKAAAKSPGKALTAKRASRNGVKSASRASSTTSSKRNTGVSRRAASRKPAAAKRATKK